ncbi:thioredoxin domain-containing protein [Saccharibacillus sp. JS10]|uniref:DsbA family protein n=1 Tax=Saccharibacillus sp. JS10 TaxID=2950552 RepID=UPI00210C81D7|nr:thioredoxin domain-containing protein [Saccharibacillus sp. JS10]MCQ4087117.1 DsbA family protein [Saccharibacillus sp. JS10]
MSKNKKSASKNRKPQTTKSNTGGAGRPQNTPRPQNPNSAASQWTSGSKRKKSNLSAIALGFVGLIVVLAVLIFVLTKVGQNQSSSAEPVVLTNYEATNQPTLGDPDSKIKIVEFGDFKCPDCKLWSETVFPDLKAKYLDTNEASFQFADYPFLADDSTLLALGGQALYEQNPEYFWTYYKAVYTNQDTSKVRESWITEDYIVNLVKENVPGADLEKFTSDLKNKTYQAAVDADVKAGDDSKISGTPSIFVNGTKVENPTLENVEAAIAAAKAS